MTVTVTVTARSVTVTGTVAAAAAAGPGAKTGHGCRVTAGPDSVGEYSSELPVAQWARARPGGSEQPGDPGGAASNPLTRRLHSTVTVTVTVTPADIRVRTNYSRYFSIWKVASWYKQLLDGIYHEAIGIYHMVYTIWYIP
jgi:hypothetical protein